VGQIEKVFCLGGGKGGRRSACTAVTNDEQLQFQGGGVKTKVEEEKELFNPIDRGQTCCQRHCEKN